MRSFLRESDVFLLPSRSEGLPNTLLEAMDVGLVCVARNVGGVGEIWPQSAPLLLLPFSTNLKNFSDVLASLLKSGEKEILKQGKLFWSVANANTQKAMIQQVEYFFASKEITID